MPDRVRSQSKMIFLIEADNVIRYSLVRDDGQWKIDDIAGASDGEPWSIRGMLADSLKN